MGLIATRTFRVQADADAATRTIMAAGVSATIVGITLTADGAANTVAIQDAAGAAITDVSSEADGTGEISTSFMNANGMLLVFANSNSTSWCTVYVRENT